MQTQYKLAERAVLMRMSAGLPGKNRKDRTLTENVKSEHKLGQRSGSWVKHRWPDWALEPLEKLVNEARAYHAAVTLPFDAGIGILPSALIMEYGDRMRDYRGRFESLRDIEKLTAYRPDALRQSVQTRTDVQKQALETLKRLEGYKL